MYGLDKTINLNFLVQKRLDQVCIGLSNVILKFSDDVSISLESSIEITSGDSLISIAVGAAELVGALTNLLGQSVESVVNEGNGNISLSFSSGVVIRILDDRESYESYEILGPGIHIVV